MNRGLVKAIIVLPGTALVFVPALILAAADNSNFSHQFATPDRILFWIALLPVIIGIGLAIWAVRLFMKFGDGTPVPIFPSTRLVCLWHYLSACGMTCRFPAWIVLLGTWSVVFRHDLAVNSIFPNTVSTDVKISKSIVIQLQIWFWRINLITEPNKYSLYLGKKLDSFVNFISQ